MRRLILNPSATVKFYVSASVPEWGPAAIALDVEADEAVELARCIRRSQRGEDDIVEHLSVKARERLLEAGVLIEAPPSFVAGRDDPGPPARTPRDLIMELRPLARDRYWSPDVWSRIWGRDNVLGELFQGSDSHYLFEDPRTAGHYPVELTAAEYEEVTAASLAAGVSDPLFSKLRLARAAVPQDEAKAREALVMEARATLAGQGYVVVKELLPPAIARSVRAFMRRSMAKGDIPRDTTHCDRRWFFKNHPIGDSLAWAIQPLVSGIVSDGRSNVRPSFSILATYGRGSELARHSDRPQCAWNVSICLGTETGAEAPPESWPLKFWDDGELVGSAPLGLGDAVVYSGERTAHSRDRLEQFDHFHAAFFCFVDSNFFGPVD